LQRLQGLDEGLGIGPHSREFFNGRQHIERRGVAIGSSPFAKAFAFARATPPVM